MRLRPGPIVSMLHLVDTVALSPKREQTDNELPLRRGATRGSDSDLGNGTERSAAVSCDSVVPGPREAWQGRCPEDIVALHDSSRPGPLDAVPVRLRMNPIR